MGVGTGVREGVGVGSGVLVGGGVGGNTNANSPAPTLSSSSEERSANMLRDVASAVITPRARSISLGNSTQPVPTPS